MQINQFKLIIIGGGPNGLACAIEAQKRGISVLVIEKGTIAESIRRYPYQMTFFSTADNIAIGDIPFTIDKPKATREEALNYYRRVVEFYNIPIRLCCKVVSLVKKDDLFYLDTNVKDQYIAEHVVISTGYFDFPRKLNVPGETMAHVKHYYDEPYKYAHQHVAIIGGGNSAVETALSLYRHGVQVSMIVRSEAMKKTAKYWLLPDLLNRIKEGSIKVYYNHEVIQIKKKYVITINRKENKSDKIQADYVFVLTGYLPDVSFMIKSGIQINDKTLEPFYDKNTFETNVPGLYVAGTVTAGIHTEKVFIENGRLHGKFIVEDILKKKLI